MRVIFVLILERLVCSGIFVFKTKTIYYLLFMIKTYLNILDSWNILKIPLEGKERERGIWGRCENRGQRGREEPEGEVSTCISHGREKRRIRKWQKESERYKWYHIYVTSTHGRQDDFRLQAGFTPVNGVILYDQVTIRHVKRGSLWWFVLLCS